MTHAPRVTQYCRRRAGRRGGRLVYNVVLVVCSQPPTYRALFGVGDDDFPTPGQDFASAFEAIAACRDRPAADDGVPVTDWSRDAR